MRMNKSDQVQNLKIKKLCDINESEVEISDDETEVGDDELTDILKGVNMRSNVFSNQFNNESPSGSNMSYTSYMSNNTMMLQDMNMNDHKGGNIMLSRRNNYSQTSIAGLSGCDIVQAPFKIILNDENYDSSQELYG